MPARALQALAAVAAEIGLALLQEGPRPFRVFLVTVDRREQRAGGKIRRVEILVGAGVERQLGDAYALRALVEDFLAPFVDQGIEFLFLAHEVDEPHVDGLLCRVLAAPENHLARLALADVTREQLASAPDRDASHLWPGLAENSPLAGEGHVAEQVDLVAAAHAVAADLGE